MTDEQKAALQSVIAHCEKNGYWEADSLKELLAARDGQSGESEQEAFESWWKADVVLQAVDMEWTDEKCQLGFIAGYRAALSSPASQSAENRGEDAVYYRFRHSETEKWHYGPAPQSWWECQALGVIAKGEGK